MKQNQSHAGLNVSLTSDLNNSKKIDVDFQDQNMLILECYDVILNLFMALDKSIQEMGDSKNLVSKVKLLMDLKKYQKDDAGYEAFVNKYTNNN